MYTRGGLRESVALNALGDYVTEDGNPGNRKEVASVEISYPASFFESRTVLIDTPGVGSTHAQNTRTTQEYLKQVDAGIVVLSADLPITEAESQFLRRIKDAIPRLFFLVNKTDIASSEEIHKIIEFLQRELSRLQITSPEIFSISARQALHEKRVLASEGRNACEMALFESRLQDFLLLEKRDALVSSVASDALQLACTLRFAAAIGVRAGELSSEALESKRVALDRLLAATETAIRELQVLLRQRCAEILDQVEQDLKAQVESHVPKVQQDLKAFEAQHRTASGQKFGGLLEEFLMWNRSFRIGVFRRRTGFRKS